MCSQQYCVCKLSSIGLEDGISVICVELNDYFDKATFSRKDWNGQYQQSLHILIAVKAGYRILFGVCVRNIKYIAIHLHLRLKSTKGGDIVLLVSITRVNKSKLEYLNSRYFVKCRQQKFLD